MAHVGRRLLSSTGAMRNRNPNQNIFRLLFVVSVALNAYFLFFKQPPPPMESSESLKVPVHGVTVSDGPPVELAEGGGVPDGIAVVEALIDTGAVEGVAETPGKIVDPKTGLRYLSLDLVGSIARTFGAGIGRKYGDLVSAVFARIYVWKLDLRADTRKNDRLQLVYRVLPKENQVEIQAASYESRKNRIGYRAYWYRPSGRKFGSYFDENGREIAATLVNGPIRVYEQITSLLREGRRHQGIDFKAPVGTEVVTPFDGKVRRVNWKSANGVCIEIYYPGKKVIAKYLHLDRIAPGILSGKKVKAGQVIAFSGNTGHSTAPHLHYQLERMNHRIINPLEFHELEYKQLSDSDMLAFVKTRDRWRAVLRRDD